ncbi:MAG: carbohydrate kinase [Burkholderiaceae bacterium]|nr:carbohydrate kinase [Microbacteriaceae bacterium]
MSEPVSEQHSTDDLWLGVDLGTQSAKVSVVDGHGRVRAAASEQLRSRREERPGEGARHEQDPGDWVGAVRRAMAVAVGTLDAGERARIRGVAVCATSGTIAVVDGAGTPVSGGLMYDDARAGFLSAEVGAADPAPWARLGYRIQPTWALPKILWLQREGMLDGNTGARRHIAHQGDVLATAMTGTRVASDWSHALKSGYDLIDLEWPAAVLARLGIDPAVLPEVVAPGTELGRTTTGWQALTGLLAGTPVYAGMTDGCAAQLGSATLGIGDWHTVIGTTLVVKGVSPTIVTDDTGAVYSHRAPHDGLWLPGGASNAGAGAISFLFPGDDLAARTAAVAGRFTDRVDLIPTGYPITGRGERFPVVRPDASGFLTVGGSDVPLNRAADVAGTSHPARAPLDGARLDGARLDPDMLLAAILLGVACVERLAVDTMAAAGVPVSGTFSTSGGGTRNRWWTQLRADLLGREITIPVSSEGSIGMAILAAWAGGAGALPEVAARMSIVGDVIEPDAARRAALDERYGVFRDGLVARGWLDT